MTDDRQLSRPSLYTEEIVAEIVERVSGGETLIRTCKFDRLGNEREKGTFPSVSAVYRWADPDADIHRPEFMPRFARARLDQQLFWLEEIVDIANTPEPGFEEVIENSKKFGITVRRARKDMLHHRMLKIDTRLRAIARMNPQLWAERLQQPAKDDEPVTGDRLIIIGGLPDNDKRE